MYRALPGRNDGLRDMWRSVSAVMREDYADGADLRTMAIFGLAVS